MLHVPKPSYDPWTYNNFGTNPSATPGTSVTPGASNVEGTYTQIASSADIAQDVVAFMITIKSGATAANAKNHIFDIGVDPAGGTSYTTAISNVVCGASGTGIAMPGHFFLFPLAIKAGSSVAIRIQGSNATAGTVRVTAEFYGQSSVPEFFPNGQFSETIGTITNSNGVSFTPGNAANGTWVSLGTTTNAMWWWQLAYQIDNGTITAEYTYIDLAWGDGTNKHIIKRIMHGGNTSEQIGDFFAADLNPFNSFCPVPAGATLYVRGRCLNAPDTGYNAVAIGIGG